MTSKAVLRGPLKVMGSLAYWVLTMMEKWGKEGDGVSRRENGEDKP